MGNYLLDILQGKDKNHIAPFLWIHGEEETVLRHEIMRIYECGIREFCVEARPHRDFNGPGWFRDLEIILGVCKDLGMGIWILDDAISRRGLRMEKRKKIIPVSARNIFAANCWIFADQ